MTGNQTGALYMTIGMVAYTCNDALVKLLGSALPLAQILTLRGLMASAFLFLLAYRMGGLGLPRTARGWGFLLLRSLAEVSATYFFLTALLVMPIANATSILQVLPLSVALAASVFLGERVGWRRMAAIWLGFCGMLLIVRPGPDGFATGTGYAVAAVALVTLRELLTRKMPVEIQSMTVALSTALGVALFGAVLSLNTAWQPLSRFDIVLLCVAAGFIFVGYLCSVLAMRVGEISFTAPFRYTAIIAALIAGWLIFGEWPDAVTGLGAAIVVGAGLFMLYRESRAG